MVEILKLKKINKIYGETLQFHVLHDIDLSISDSSLNVLVGKSGSGKTTLLQIMGTLDNPTSGDVYISNVKTNDLKENELSVLRNQEIGFIFQFHYLLPEFTVMENILMPAYINNSKLSDEVIDKANELMTKIDITDIKNKLIKNISGGEQQRTAIARALINDPKIVFADEPTGNLDSVNTEKILSLIQDIHETYGTTFLIVTHSETIASRIDRVIEISDGRISNT